jgi:hypothetical protein
VPLNSFEPHIVYLILLAAAAMSLLVVVVRCFTLLVGLVITLAKAPSNDRSEIFREFARAVSGAESSPRHGPGGGGRLEPKLPDGPADPSHSFRA